MRLSRTDLVPVLAIIAGGAVGLLTSASLLRSARSDYVLAPLTVWMTHPNVRLSGTVTDESGAAWNGAQIDITGGPRSASVITDAQGRYQVTLAAGTYDLVVTSVGARDMRIENVSVSAGPPTIHDIVLPTRAEELDVIVVVVSRGTPEKSTEAPATVWMTHEGGLVAHYPLDGNADDASGNSHDGSAYGATLIRDRNGVADRAYRLGNSDYISLDANAFDRLNDFTLSFWVLFDSFNEGHDAYNTILSVASQYQDNELLVGYASHKTYRTVFRNQFFIAIDTEFGPNPDLRPFDANTVVKDGEWHCITLIRSGSTATLYIDGSRAGGSIDVPSAAIGATGNGAIIGQEQDDVGTRFGIHKNLSGRIDDVYVYDRVLSESEVQTLYSRTSRELH